MSSSQSPKQCAILKYVNSNIDSRFLGSMVRKPGNIERDSALRLALVEFWPKIFDQLKFIAFFPYKIEILQHLRNSTRHRDFILPIMVSVYF